MKNEYKIATGRPKQKRSLESLRSVYYKTDTTGHNSLRTVAVSLQHRNEQSASIKGGRISWQLLATISFCSTEVATLTYSYTVKSSNAVLHRLKLPITGSVDYTDWTLRYAYCVRYRIILI
jgi:hypothetical protein